MKVVKLMNSPHGRAGRALADMALIADLMQAKTGQPFTEQPPGRLDLYIGVDRTRQPRAALAHASQISPPTVVCRRWQLQGGCEHLRWLRPPQA